MPGTWRVMVVLGLGVRKRGGREDERVVGVRTPSAAEHAPYGQGQHAGEPQGASGLGVGAHGYRPLLDAGVDGVQRTGGKDKGVDLTPIKIPWQGTGAPSLPKIQSGEICFLWS